MSTLPPVTVPTGLVVVDHGSRLDEANRMLDAVADLVRCRAANRYVAVEPAHMELAEPSIMAAVDRCVAAGARRVVVCLFFLSPGRHSTKDIPRLAQEAAARHAGLDVVVAEPLGADERLAAIVLERAQAALRG